MQAIGKNGAHMYAFIIIVISAYISIFIVGLFLSLSLSVYLCRAIKSTQIESSHINYGYINVL